MSAVHGWSFLKLRDIASLKTGPFGSALHKSDYIVGGIPLINPTHIKGGRLVPSTDVSVPHSIAAGLAEYRLNEGDIVMGRRGEMGRCAVVPGHAQDWICGTGSVVVKCSPAAMPAYLQRFLTAPATVAALIGDSVGSTMINLNQGVLLDLDIPLAPLPEQKRIADKLDSVLARVDACRDRLDRLPALLKRFRRSVLAAATSGRLTKDWREATSNCMPSCDEPIGWTVCKIKDAGKVQLGRQRSPKFHSGESMRPYLRVQNVFEDRLDFSDVMTMDFPGEDFERYQLHPGDILLNEGQSPEYLGRPAMYRGELPGACFTNTLIRFQAYSHVKPDYALMVFRNHMHSGRYITEGTITTNIAHLGAGRFSEVEFPLPPMQEQHEIVRRVDVLFAFADRLEARLATARKQVEQLTPALLAKAFRGELVPQDPADEPAAELLKRLATKRATAPQTRRGRKAVPSN
ncbi:restriction endonuclease subunit S [Aromatoleum diolicum]|uniref:Restriction endonuclease subunit S n=1 Tax=Aromatoleum diolicum TaxID=75796 RepID=A0ABX1Q7Q1_9RHOO|nr:restriction endonuclease subunit S [Aromatoleum diolicum]NMG73427.1 restriction endonuclease subunit S [Aromatoleum diolicum]